MNMNKKQLDKDVYAYHQGSTRIRTGWLLCRKIWTRMSRIQSWNWHRCTHHWRPGSLHLKAIRLKYGVMNLKTRLTVLAGVKAANHWWASISGRVVHKGVGQTISNRSTWNQLCEGNIHKGTGKITWSTWRVCLSGSGCPNEWISNGEWLKRQGSSDLKPLKTYI